MSCGGDISNPPGAVVQITLASVLATKQAQNLFAAFRHANAGIVAKV
jgi:hypothetical protein